MKHLNQMKWFSTSQYLNVLSTLCSWQAEVWPCGKPSTATTKYIFATITGTVFGKCDISPQTVWFPYMDTQYTVCT